MEKQEILKHLGSIIRDLHDLGVENSGVGGTVEVRHDLDYTIGSHDGSCRIDVEIDLDEIDEYTDLRDEAASIVEAAHAAADRLKDIRDSLEEADVSEPLSQEVVVRWASDNNRMLLSKGVVEELLVKAERYDWLKHNFETARKILLGQSLISGEETPNA